MPFRERVQTDPEWQPLSSEPEPLEEARAWSLLLAAAKAARQGRVRAPKLVFSVDETGQPRELASGPGCLSVETDTARFELGRAAPPAVERMLELYLPICLGRGRPTLCFAHLGQSLDGQIATSTGASQYVTGPENICHLHRLRALSDAVLVGAGTVERDDPQLTTRLVPGENPVRVVIDPRLRLPASYRLFREPAASTLVICEERAAGGRSRHGEAEVVALPSTDAGIAPLSVVEALASRGLRFLFVEGGGVTVSRFLAARALDRLHVTVSPVFLGQGRPGLVLPAISELTAALRPSVRRFTLGDDVLFDCEL